MRIAKTLLNIGTFTLHIFLCVSMDPKCGHRGPQI